MACNKLLCFVGAVQFIGYASALDGISHKLQLEGDAAKLRVSLKGQLKKYLQPIAGRDSMLAICILLGLACRVLLP